MASLSLHRGLAPHSLQSGEAIIVAGQADLIRSLPLSTCLGGVNGDLLHECLSTLVPTSGVVPVHLNRVKVLVIPPVSPLSRSNSPANPIAFKTLLKQAINGADKTTTMISIILATKYEHAVAHVAAIARLFPLFSRKTTSKAPPTVRVECCFDDDEKVSEADFAALGRLANAIRATAQLVDAPPNELNVNEFVHEAVAVGQTLGIEDPIVIRGDELRERGFGGIYHVGKAAMQPPAFVCLSHKPVGATKSFALVGKGIMFDTGGLTIKGKTAMPGWKCDMAGAAAALHAFATLVGSGFTEQLHVLLCCAENAVSPVANKPDDIITLLSGKTVEINNTDAEGRLVLADGVFYAQNVLKASTIIDIATLTVAQGTVTGKHHAAIMSNCECLEKKARRVGIASGDLCHPMQFVPDLHMADYNSAVADMKNAQLGEMMAAPSELAGLFIGAQIDFGKDGTQWLHVDMGCLAMAEDRATAYGVPLLTALLAEHTNAPILSGGELAA